VPAPAPEPEIELGSAATKSSQSKSVACAGNDMGRGDRRGHGAVRTGAVRGTPWVLDEYIVSQGVKWIKTCVSGWSTTGWKKMKT